MPEEVGEEQARLDLLAVAAAVDGDVDRDHAAPSLARGRPHDRRARGRGAAGSRATRGSSPTARPARPPTRPGRSGSTSSTRRPVDDRPDDDPQLVAADARRGHAERVVAAALRELLEGESVAVGRAVGQTVSTTSSSGASAVVYGPRKSSSAGIVAPPARATRRRPSRRPRRARAEARAAASACAIEPPTVPRFRVTKWPTWGSDRREQPDARGSAGPPGGRSRRPAARRPSS